MTFLRRFFLPVLSILLLWTACETPVEVKKACGDDFVDPGEECDGDQVPTQNCEQLGYYSSTGPITCTGDCRLDLSTCASRCGDGVIQGQHGEECDGAELGGETCVGQGLGSGTLACTTQCRFDTSACSEVAVCDDGLLAPPAEECDLSDLNGATCQSLGWYGGELACDDCRFDTTHCRTYGRCGDGELQPAYGEACDGYQLNGQTCEGLLYHGGELTCDADCRYDLTACEAAGRCGDGILQAPEACDGDDLGTATCDDFFPGYPGGNLTCDADCAVDTTGCARCGDGILQAPELCDGDDLGTATCETLGEYPGVLGCSADCAQLLTGTCGGSCGDGVVQTPFSEACDPAAPLTATCASLSLGLGSPACGDDCALVTAGCVRATALGGGASSGCALLEDGTVRCWGRNDQGTLGDGTLVNRNTPAPVSGLSGALAIAGGISNHVCVLQTSGVSCWGFNSYGQLGNGSIANATSPVAVSGLTDAVQVSVGGWSSCARRAGGAVVCWGRNDSGQLGNGTETSSSIPVTVTGITGAVDISVGYEYACAALAGGGVRCWGKNLSGQLGDGTTAFRNTPVAVLTQAAPAIQLMQVTHVVAGHEHTCAIQAGTGAVSCWGRNTFGQLGDGTQTDRLVAVPVLMLTSVTAVSAGYNHTCAIAGGSVSCWGANLSGQLGLGDTTDRLLPVSLPGLTGVLSVIAGLSHTCFALTTGVVRCTGDNSLGQLGDGSNTNTLTPGFVQ